MSLKTMFAALLSGMLAAGCGGKVVVDAESTQDTAAEASCVEGGGTWESDGCAGASDHCNQGACLASIGMGCQCAGSACWDGVQQKCVAPTP